MDRHRLVSPRQLVFALRAGLDTRQAMGNRVVDGLMVAQFEMQEGVVFDAAPVAAIDGIGPQEIQRPAIARPSLSAMTSRISSRIVSWMRSKKARVR